MDGVSILPRGIYNLCILVAELSSLMGFEKKSHFECYILFPKTEICVPLVQKKHLAD